MVIGSLLLQPQRLQRASQRAAENALLDDVIGLAVCLLLDEQLNGNIAQTMGESLGGTVEHLSVQAGAGVNSAVTRFGTLFQPLIAPITALGEPADDPLDALLSAEHGLETVVHLLKGLTAPAIRQHMNEFFDILTTDLGITPNFVGELVLGIFEDMAAALLVTPADESDDQRANRRAAADRLRRIKRWLGQHFIFPTINADAAAQALIDLLLRREVAEALDRVACTSEAVSAYFHAADTLIEAIPYSASEPFGVGGMGAAAAPDAREEISFYGSKLLEYDNVKGDLGKLPPNTALNDGPASIALREAFRPLSVVLSSSAFVYTVKDNQEWHVVDRKKYLMSAAMGTLFVYRLFEISEGDLSDSDPAHIDNLRKIFRENGYVLSGDINVTHEVNSNAWSISIGGVNFSGIRESGTITVRPLSRTYVLFELNAQLQPASDAKKPSDDLRAAFASNGVLLTSKCSLSTRTPGTEWLIDDDEFDYEVERDGQDLNVSLGGGFFAFIRSTIAKKPKGDVVWINKERTQVLLGQRIMHTGTDVTWNQTPIFTGTNPTRHYSFKGDPNSTEQWAYHLSWIADALHVIVDAVNIGITASDGTFKYSAVSSINDTGRYLAEVIVKLATRRPMSELIHAGYWYDLGLDAGAILIKAIESALKPSTPTPPGVSKFSELADTILSAIFGAGIVDSKWTDTLCEFILSTVTLYNHVEPTQAGQERPDNYKENGGFVDLFMLAGVLVYTAIIPDSEYAYPFQTTPLTAGYWVGGMVGVGAVMGFVGFLVGQGVVARMNVFADVGHLFKTVGKSSGMSLLYFWPFLKLTHGRAT